MFAGTASVSILIMGMTMLLTGVLATRLGPEQFGAYMLARRLVTTALPFTTMAMGIALPRYVSTATDADGRAAYLVAGLILGLLPGVMVLLVGWPLAGPVAHLLYGRTEYSGLWLGTLVLLLGTTCLTLMMGYCRGLGRMDLANIWRFACLGIGPVVVVYSVAPTSGANPLLILMGLLGCTALLAVIRPVGRALAPPRAASGVGSALRDLCCYGLPRAPAGVALTWILALGPFLASRHEGMAHAGFLLAGQALLQSVDVAVSAFGLIVLPKVAVMHSQGRTEFLRECVGDVIAFVCHLGLFASLHLWIWSRPLILTWLGAQYGEAVTGARLMLLALTPYIAYVMLRSIIDGIEDRPINTINLYLSLLATGIGSFVALQFGLGTLGLVLASCLGLWLLASLTLAFLWRQYGLETGRLLLDRCAILNLVLLIPSVAAASFLQSLLKGWLLLGAGVLVEGGLLALYGVLLWRLRVRWVAQLLRRIIPAPSGA
jgi:O-antigen/teichoic acid export membrane protein